MGKITFHKNIQQGSQEWLDLRRGKVTCSNALTVMNRGVKACIADNLAAATRLKPNGNAYAERGHAIEAEYKEEFNKTLKESGLYLDECGFITNSDYPTAGYSPDGLVREIESDKLITFAEFKAYNDITIDKHGREVLSCKHRRACRSLLDVPPECIAQCNMAMLITETEEMYLFLCNPDAQKTNQMIKKLLMQVEYGDKEASLALKKACPDGEYEWKVPATHIWKISRSKPICDRIISGLNR